MLKFFWSFIILFFLFAPLHAQDTISLKRIFHGNGTAAEKANASWQLAWRFHDNKQIADAIHWAEQGISYALKSNDDSLIYLQYSTLTEFQEEAGYTEDAKAAYYEYIDLQKKTKSKHKWLAIVYNNLAVLYGDQGMYPQSVENYILAGKIYQGLGLKNDAAETEANMAAVFIAQGNSGKTIQTLRPLIEHFKATNNQRMLASSYNNTANAFTKLKQRDSAFHYSSLGITAARATANPDKLYSAWSLRASISFKLGDNEEFKKANDSMLYYAKLSGNLQNEASTYSNLGLYYATVTGDMLKAKEYFELALASSIKLGSKDMTVGVLNNLATTYAELGDHARAFKLMEHAYKLKDSIITDAGIGKIAEMQTRFQTEKKEAQIKLLDESNKLQKRTSYFLIAGLTLLVIAGLSLYRNNRIKQKSNKQLAILNNSLEEANQTKAKLFGIISHDLRSPISQVYQFLKLQQMAPDRLNEEQRNNLSNKIQSAAGSLLETMEDLLLWSKTQMNQFHTDMQLVAVDKVAGECLQLLQLNIEAKNITVTNRLSSEIIVKSDPYFLQTILRNLLQNAIKAAPENGEIIIGCKGQQLMIKNNGGHFSQQQYEATLASKEDANSLSGLGLRLIDELSKKIGVTIVFENPDDNTTQVNMVLPIK